MKVAICVREIGNDRFISPSLSEANYYILVDSEINRIQDKILNSYTMMKNDGSEIFCSQLLISKGVNKVICGNCEHDAKRLFKDANVEVINNLGTLLEEYFPNRIIKNNFSNEMK